MPSNWENQPMQPGSHLYFMRPQSFSPDATRSTTYNSGVNVLARSDGLTYTRRTNSPPFPFHEDDILDPYNPPNATR